MKIHKALTFRASSIGDGLMARYLLENVHVAYPDAKLALIVAGRGAMLRDLLSTTPWLTLVETNRRDLGGLVKLISTWGGSDFTVTQYTGKVGTSFGLASKVAARLLTKPGRLLGFTDAFKGNRFIYDHLLPVRDDLPVVGNEREALKALGVPVSVPYPRLPHPTEFGALETFGLTDSGFIITHFFAGNKTRSISPQHARELVELLHERFPDVQIVVSGAPADVSTVEKIIGGLSYAMSVAGKASLTEMMQLVMKAKGVVSVDTGIAHITAHLSRPLVVLRTCLWPNWWFPEAYGPQAPIAQFANDDSCKPHKGGDYPPCIDGTDLVAVANGAKTLFV